MAIEAGWHPGEGYELPCPPEPADLLDPEPPVLTWAEVLSWDEWGDRPAPPLPEAPEEDPEPPVARDELGWAVPGLGAPEAEGGLSAASEAALREVAEAVTAQRSAGARVYRAIAALETGDVLAETGYRSVSRLLEDHVRLDARTVNRLARQADLLAPTVTPTGTSRPATLPATGEQVDEGAIGEEHVEIIRLTMQRLRAVDGLDEATLEVTERQLAELATTHSPKALRAAADVIADRLDPDGAAPQEDPEPVDELHYLRRRKTGFLEGKFIYRDPASVELMMTALAAATPPSPAAPLADPETGRWPVGEHGQRGESPEAHAARTMPARRAAGLLDLAAEGITRGLNVDDPARPASPTPATTTTDLPDDEQDTTSFGIFAPEADDVGADTDTEVESDAGPDRAPPAPGSPSWSRPELEGGERIALTVTLDYRTLRQQITDTGQALALLGDDTMVRPRTARRLACDAEIVPVVLGGASEVLDIGRKSRVVPSGMRRAVVLRDRHCAFPGCRRRARKCQAHHIEHWADGGPTELDNLVLLCLFHHQLVHHGGWEVVMVDHLPWFVPPPWLNPGRTPRHNRPGRSPA